MDGLLQSWLLKIEEVSSSVKAKQAQLQALSAENEDLDVALEEEQRKRQMTCKALNKLRVKHAQQREQLAGATALPPTPGPSLDHIRRLASNRSCFKM
jgi:hypothetical protein